MGDLRSKIKHNFLKNLIFRLDFSGILESDIEKCVEKLRQNFFDAGFVNMENRELSKVDLQVKTDLNIPDENRFSVNNSNRSSVFRFSSNNNEVLELNKSFFTLTIDIDQVYETFDKYIDLLSETVTAIKSISPYFRALRVGLRKINICYLKSLSNLPSYFAKAAFNMDDLTTQFFDCNVTASNMVTILSKNGYQINYVRNLQEGVMQQENEDQQKVYQVVLDIDVYQEDNRKIALLLSNNEHIRETLIDQNTLEFDIFIKSLNESFIDMLQQEIFSDSNIIGVI